MKKIITLFAVFVLVACAKEKQKDYVVFSGKLTEVNDGKLTLRGLSFDKQIDINADGTFSDTLHLPYNGTYSLFLTNTQVDLYLEKDKDINVDADYSNFLETASFTGSLAEENNYVVKKAALRKELGTAAELYSLEETEFLEKSEDWNNKVIALADEFTFNTPDFKENELKNIAYSEQEFLLNYPNNHRHFTNNPEYEPSENFPAFDESADLDNATDYNFSTTYRRIVSSRFSATMMDEYNQLEDGSVSDYYNIGLKKLRDFQSQNIKDNLAKNIAYGISPSNDNSEAMYNELMSIISDESFKADLTEKYDKIKTLIKGNPSPKFDYENYAGGTTSLDDLKGKFVYIDVWATWCGPCIREIPFLKETEEEYHNKNIEFVSISIDTKKDYEKWRNFVAERELTGVQLFADDDWKSQFVQDYAIEGIPRFILVDTEGNIVNADAPRPSNPKLKELFSDLGI